MIQYYVIDKEDEDFDLDAEPSYSSREEAQLIKKRLEKNNPETEYNIWEVD